MNMYNDGCSEGVHSDMASCARHPCPVTWLQGTALHVLLALQIATTLKCNIICFASDYVPHHSEMCDSDDPPLTSSWP